METDPPANRHTDEEAVMSASQLGTWAECRRLWGWKYIDKLRPPPAGSAALGTNVHAQLEAYLKGGELDFTKPNHVADIAASGLSLLPRPGSIPMEVERGFKFQSPDTGFWYRGFVDLAIAPEHNDGIPKVLDHKTTSNLRWAKTEEDLETDIQAILYAKEALLRYPDAPAVELQWTYYQTKGARNSLAVNVVLTREHVEETFAQIELGTSAILSTLVSKTPTLDLPPNPKACGNYGGCPFRHKCNLSPDVRSPFEMNTHGSSPLNNMLARLSGEPATPPPTPAAPTVNLLDLLRKPAAETPISAYNAAGVTSGRTQSAESPYAEGCEPAAPTEIPAVFLATDQPINPPEYQPPPPTGAAAAPTPEPKKPGRPKGSKNKKTSENTEGSTPPEASVVMGAATPTSTPAEAPKEPGVLQPQPFTEHKVAGGMTILVVDPATALPTAFHTDGTFKSIDVDTLASGMGVTKDAALEVIDQLGHDKLKDMSQTGWTLYVDCFPVGTKATTAEKLIARAQEENTRTTGLADYRYHEYGKGPGVLSALVAGYAATGEYGDIVLDTRTPEGSACKAALCNTASRVVMGMGR